MDLEPGKLYRITESSTYYDRNSDGVILDFVGLEEYEFCFILSCKLCKIDDSRSKFCYKILLKNRIYFLALSSLSLEEIS